jgi:hypothetical protein
MIRPHLLGALVVLASGAAPAVGLGPLWHKGVTASDRKGFYLTLINPYPTSERFRLRAIGWDDDLPQTRARLPQQVAVLPGGAQRRVLVIAGGLAPGETLNFRVCAERAQPDQKDLIHARVCAKLTAHRLG